MIQSDRGAAPPDKDRKLSSAAKSENGMCCLGSSRPQKPYNFAINMCSMEGNPDGWAVIPTGNRRADLIALLHILMTSWRAIFKERNQRGGFRTLWLPALQYFIIM